MMRKFSTSCAMQQSVSLLSKFRGSILGGLIGDCCGEPFEGTVLSNGDKAILRRTLNQLEASHSKGLAKKYTDDSAMTRSVIECLIVHKDISSKELAKSFVEEYFRDSNRGYGSAIGEVFQKLQRNNLSDVIGPAKEQFAGSGSYGNGAAMRVSPVGLFCYDKVDRLVELARKSAEVTHANNMGINGAILQALAINICVRKDPIDFTASGYLDELIPKISEIESNVNELKVKGAGPNFEQQMAEVKRMLAADTPVSEDEVLNTLGHDVAAIYSVPTAIFAFLRALSSIPGITSDNPFRRTLEYAISLGGDTDTIASMACSLTGALYGDKLVSENLIKHCEGHEEFTELACKLHEASI